MKKAYLIIFLIVISSLVIFPIGISAYSPYSKIFQEDFSYGYKLQTTSDDKDSISYSRFHFHYYEPFFLDSDNLAAFYKLSNGLISVGIKKWDLNDYNLALGLKFEQINMFNLNAENFEPYHFNESAAFEGNYSQWTLFSEWILSEKERLNLVYQNRSNNYSKNSSTPVNYTVPQDNMVHSISGE